MRLKSLVGEVPVWRFASWRRPRRRRRPDERAERAQTEGRRRPGSERTLARAHRDHRGAGSHAARKSDLGHGRRSRGRAVHLRIHGDGPMVPAPGAVQSPGHNVEASKTEPDKNTYLVLHGQTAPTRNYDYGTHFLFQGHETGDGRRPSPAINLDADGAHRVTLWPPRTSTARPPVIDGSTWDPFAHGCSSPPSAARGRRLAGDSRLSRPTVDDISRRLRPRRLRRDPERRRRQPLDRRGRRRHDGCGEHAREAAQQLRLPLRPDDKSDLTSRAASCRRCRSSRCAPASRSCSTRARPTPTSSRRTSRTSTRTARRSHAVGDAPRHRRRRHRRRSTPTRSPRRKLATPFKRPENGQFRPGTGFREFFFDETGDTDAADRGRRGVRRLRRRLEADARRGPSRNGHARALLSRRHRPQRASTTARSGDSDHVVFVEDAGDTLHAQRNALDSALAVRRDGRLLQPGATSRCGSSPEGRDASATHRLGARRARATASRTRATTRSPGSTSPTATRRVGGILGAKIPRPFEDGWRVFYTQQHGDNVTWEILRKPGRRDWDQD